MGTKRGTKVHTDFEDFIYLQSKSMYFREKCKTLRILSFLAKII